MVYVEAFVGTDDGGGVFLGTAFAGDDDGVAGGLNWEAILFAEVECVRKIRVDLYDS